jgi:SulP family sulfate permease
LKGTPNAGMIASIICGLCSGLLGGSHYNIIGPTGALSGFLANAVVKFDDGTRGECLPVMALVTGIVIFIMYILKWEKYAQLFPESVNEGFTFGVASKINLVYSSHYFRQPA